MAFKKVREHRKHGKSCWTATGVDFHDGFLVERQVVRSPLPDRLGAGAVPAKAVADGPLHRGSLFSRDPLALAIGRMQVIIRARQAAMIEVASTASGMVP